MLGILSWSVVFTAEPGGGSARQLQRRLVDPDHAGRLAGARSGSREPRVEGVESCAATRWVTAPLATTWWRRCRSSG
jgi:hypothetical protein